MIQIQTVNADGKVVAIVSQDSEVKYVLRLWGAEADDVEMTLMDVINAHLCELPSDYV